MIALTVHRWQGYVWSRIMHALVRSEMVSFNVLIKTEKKEMRIKLVSKTFLSVF